MFDRLADEDHPPPSVVELLLQVSETGKCDSDANLRSTGNAA
jgi:hypothetical protein